MKLLQKLVIKSLGTFSFTISLTLLSFCSDNITTECNPELPESGSVNLSNFSELQKTVFTPSCALSGCHAGSPLQANLNLTEGNAYSNLVNVQSLLNPNFLIVDPGNSENSFLVKMLRNSGVGTSQMPPTGSLQANIIDSIEVWINKGALQN